MQEIEQLLDKLKNDLTNAKSLFDVEQIKIKYLGRNGLVNGLFQKIGRLSDKERKEYGQKANLAKKEISFLIRKREEEIIKNKEKQTFIDITLPGKKYSRGSLHIVSYAVEEISRIFEKLGFIRLTYPEVEWEYFAFESLNMPKGHPARDDFETFFIDAPDSPRYGRMMLSPHTSSGQVREMLRVGQPPIRMISIGKCYRPNWDTTHTPMFHQFEALCVDKNINIVNLKATIDFFAKEFFGKDRQIRLRPHHFQFTEPSFEVDISCGVCGGKGEINGNKCRICKSGWLELAGAGMVHPNVLKEGKIDPEKYTGWAFAFGLERIMMMKEGLSLDDIRVMYSGDIRFLEQF